MSKLQELIRELCPDGVEYKKLGDCIEIYTGIQFNKRDMSEVGTYPVLNGGMNPSGFTEKYNEEKDTITVSQGGASAGYVNWMDCKFWAGAHCFVVKPNNDVLNNRYLYFLLKNSEQILMQAKHGAGIPGLNRDKVKNLIMPVPPLEIQEEIVRILDRFAEYAAELQAELQARKEQYEYYRNKLLTFTKIQEGGAQSVTWMKMSEIGTFIRGKRFVRTDIINDGIPCIHYGDIYTYYGLYATQSKGRLRNELASKMRYAQKNDVVIVAAGENKEDIGIGLAWIGDEPAAVHDACFIFRSDLYPQYVSHYLRSDYYHKQIVKYVSEGKICSISAKGLGNAIIPIPPYEEQVRIATLLNKFDTLVGNLTEGLPAEIAAVQEQYEYYRNKLLSFPRIKISA